MSSELLRSDGSRRVCSPTENPELHRATIGGLGLTGLFTWAEIQLRAIATPFIGQETLRFENLAAFFALSEESEQDYEHTVAWMDSLATGKNLGRGVSSSVAITPETHPPTLPSRRGSGLGYPATYLCQSSTVRPSDFSTPPFTGVTRPGGGKKPCTTSPFSSRWTASATGTASTGPRGFFSTNAWYRRTQGREAVHEILERVPPGPAPALSWRY